MERPAAAGGVAAAVRQGADRSGVSFDFLLKTATRESSLDPNAAAATSSATGLFQFIEQTWLASVKADGGKYGLQRYADAIDVGAGGRMTVSDPALRREILALRKDPQASAALAGELAKRNGATLAAALGRAPSEGELYIAHVMGAGGARALIGQADATPNAAAARYFPAEAAANRNLFYARNGAPLSLAQLRERLIAGFGGEAPAMQTAAAQNSAGAWLSFLAPAATAENAPFVGLFRTDGAAPISAAVAQLWTPADAAELDSYFSVAGRDTLSAASLASAVSGPGLAPRQPGKPLDLLAMMKPAAS